MISHRWRRQGCCSSCIRFRTASRDRCVAARVMRFPIRLTSFPYNDSFLEYHTECKCVGNLCTQPLNCKFAVNLRGAETASYELLKHVKTYYFPLVKGNNLDTQ